MQVAVDTQYTACITLLILFTDEHDTSDWKTKLKYECNLFQWIKVMNEKLIDLIQGNHS